MAYQGNFPHSLDSKNRLVLPAAFRKGVPDEEARQGVITIGRCARFLKLYTRKAWDKRIEALNAKFDEDDEESEAFLRDVLSQAFDVDLDAQFRFVLLKDRRDQVGIDRDVVFAGVGDKIEIWAADRWAAHRAERAGIEASPPAKRATRASDS